MKLSQSIALLALCLGLFSNALQAITLDEIKNQIALIDNNKDVSISTEELVNGIAELKKEDQYDTLKTIIYKISSKRETTLNNSECKKLQYWFGILTKLFTQDPKKFASISKNDTYTITSHYEKDKNYQGNLSVIHYLLFRGNEFITALTPVVKENALRFVTQCRNTFEKEFPNHYITKKRDTEILIKLENFIYDVRLDTVLPEFGQKELSKFDNAMLLLLPALIGAGSTHVMKNWSKKMQLLHLLPLCITWLGTHLYFKNTYSFYFDNKTNQYAPLKRATNTTTTATVASYAITALSTILLPKIAHYLQQRAR